MRARRGVRRGPGRGQPAPHAGGPQGAVRAGGAGRADHAGLDRPRAGGRPARRRDRAPRGLAGLGRGARRPPMIVVSPDDVVSGAWGSLWQGDVLDVAVGLLGAELRSGGVTVRLTEVEAYRARPPRCWCGPVRSRRASRSRGRAGVPPRPTAIWRAVPRGSLWRSVSTAASAVRA